MAPKRARVGVVVLGAFLVAPLAQGQITTDGTLGPAGALAGPHYAIPADLGRQAGANLFHSFGLFNLATGESATFSGPGSVANIISRVTGGQASGIDGRLASTIPGANLFLINPRGVLFGPNASLDLTGSFHVSTADYLRFADGARFEATATPAPILTSAPPAAFGFLGPTGAVAFQGSTFDLAPGPGLSVAAGSITLDGALLRTRAADLRLAAVSAGELPLDATAAPSTGSAMGDVGVSFSQVRTVSSGELPPGRLVIRGGQLTIADSVVRATNGSPADAPPVELLASGDLRFSGGQFLANAQGAGRGADLVARGENVTIDRAALVQAWSTTSGAVGDIDFEARNALRVVAAPDDPDYTAVNNAVFADGSGGATRLSGDTVTVDAAIVNNVTFGAGNTGPVVMRGREVILTNGAFVLNEVKPDAPGRGDDVDIAATERVFIGKRDWWDFQSEIVTVTRGPQDAGKVRVVAPLIEVIGGTVHSITNGTGNTGVLEFVGDVIRFLGGYGGIAFVDTTSEWTATGNSGNIDVRASTSFEIGRGDNPDGWSRMTTSSFGAGRSGDVTVDSPLVTVRGLQAIWSSIFGTGDGGSIRIRAHDVNVFDNGEIQTGVFWGATGRGGDIVIEGTGRLYISGFNQPLPGGALITTLTESPGRAGDIRISIPVVETAFETGPRILSGTVGEGDAGNIEITTGRLLSRGGGIEATAFNFSSGKAGDIRIVASEAIELVGRPFYWWEGVFSRAQGTGDAGSISLAAPRIVLDDQRVWATAYYIADGGRIDIDTNELILRNGGQLDARTLDGSSGAAGSVQVRARDRIEITGMSPIDAAFSGINAQTGGSGPSGGIRIETGDLLIDRGFVKSTANGSGNAGDIDITARTVALVNGGRIDASAAPGSSGAGGSISVNATESIYVGGVDLSPIIVEQEPVPGADGVNQRGRPQGALASTITTSTAGSGAGGRVLLVAPRIDVASEGRIEATSTGTGNAGSIELVAPDALRIFGGTISSEALAADGGNIDIRVGNLVHLRNGEISTAVGSGEGSGGNITIDPTFVVLENSRIVTNAFGGPGGNIRIVADYFLSSPDSLIDASSQLGVSGRVDISAPRTDLNNGLKPLPEQFFDASTLLRETCGARAAAGGTASSLVDAGRGGLAASPERFAASSYFAGAPAAASPRAMADEPLGLRLVSAKRARLIACNG